jgi:hypothetical protein
MTNKKTMRVAVEITIYPLTSDCLVPIQVLPGPAPP